MTTTNGEGKMGKCNNLMCKDGTLWKFAGWGAGDRTGVFEIEGPCPTCSAPPPSSVPGEAGPVFRVDTNGDILGPEHFCYSSVYCPYPFRVAEMLNKVWELSRASMKAELEAARKEIERLRTALEIISDEAVSDPAGFAEAQISDAALTPKEPKP